MAQIVRFAGGGPGMTIYRLQIYPQGESFPVISALAVERTFNTYDAVLPVMLDEGDYAVDVVEDDEFAKKVGAVFLRIRSVPFDVTDEGDEVYWTNTPPDDLVGDVIVKLDRLAEDLEDQGQEQDYQTQLLLEIQAQTSGGGGAYPVTVSLLDQHDTAIADALVRMTLGPESYTLRTNADGECVFSLDSGSWQLSISKSGYQGRSESVGVSGPTHRIIELDVVATPSPLPGFVNGVLLCVSGDGTPEAGVEIRITMDTPPADAGIVYDAEMRTLMSGEHGIVVIPGLAIGARYTIRRGDSTSIKQFTTTAVDPFPIPSFRGKP